MNKSDIIVVTGLPRSGTSLMMQLLNIIGIPIFTDNKRHPDQSNPKGYFEHELVKNIEKDSTWMDKTKGKVIKIVIPLLFFLPKNYSYKVIVMKRNINEIIKSQNKMLIKENSNINPIEPDRLHQIFENQLKQTISWLNKKSNVKSINISYANMINELAVELKKVNSFLNINISKSQANSVIEKNLYRSRKT